MTEARIYRVPNRLKTLVRRPGGVMARDAILRADEAMAASFPAAIAALDVILAELDSRYGPNAPPNTDHDYEDVYGLASRIIDVSICLPGTKIEEAARALCDLADLGETLGVWDAQAIAVHARALYLLRYAGGRMNAQQRDRVLDGLRKVTIKRMREGRDATTG